MPGDRLRGRRLLRALISVGLGCGAALGSSFALAEGFLADIEDLPLAPGLSENLGEGFRFDAPAGRIVDAYANGNVDEESVIAFYLEALPQLGWTADGDRQFRRNGERLRLDMQRSEQGLVVHFSLSPQ